MTRIRTIVAALTACGLASAACAQAEGTEPRPARPVKVQTVTAGPAPTGVRYSASIEPYQEVPLAFKASGYITQLAMRRGADGSARPVQAGDQVARGLVLARVNDSDYRERVNQGRARLAEGEAALRKTRLDLTRAETLYAAESLIKPDLDAARAAFESSDARLAGTRADIELALSALADTALVAPTSGVLLERRIEVGSLVAAGTVGYVLGELTSVKARFGIPDSKIASVQLGMPIDVTVDAAPGPIAGRVTALAPAADAQSRVFEVEVTIANRDGRLRPGMIGTVALGTPATEAAAERPVMVPLTAIVRSAGNAEEYAVLVIDTTRDGDVARTRRVTLGDVLGNGVAVTAGLAAGDRVVTTGAGLLVDGDRVRIIP